jgi:hypothetical protein
MGYSGLTITTLGSLAPYQRKHYQRTYQFPSPDNQHEYCRNYICKCSRWRLCFGLRVWCDCPVCFNRLRQWWGLNSIARVRPVQCLTIDADSNITVTTGLLRGGWSSTSISAPLSYSPSQIKSIKLFSIGAHIGYGSYTPAPRRPAQARYL